MSSNSSSDFRNSNASSASGNPSGISPHVFGTPRTSDTFIGSEISGTVGAFEAVGAAENSDAAAAFAGVSKDSKDSKALNVLNASNMPESVLNTEFEPAKFRIGTVQFLNAVPLTWRLEEIAKRFNADFEVESDTPAHLADGLLSGKYDAALIPIAEAIRHPALTQISDVCIASEGTVSSIELVTFRPLDEICRVGLDPASRTSNALIQICAAERFKKEFEYIPFNVGTAMGLSECETEFLDFSCEEECEKLAQVCVRNGYDAVLLIGDKALSTPHQASCFSCVYDLGQIWTQWIGLPFVYASWFTRSGSAAERLSLIFNESRRASQVEMDVLTIHESMKRHLSIESCHEYLTRKIRYRLGGRERRGAEVFCKMMQKYGLAPLGSDLEFEANRKRFGTSENPE